jgi:hypothetical protein
MSDNKMSTKIADMLLPVPLHTENPGSITDKEFLRDILRTALIAAPVAAVASYINFKGRPDNKAAQLKTLKSRLNVSSPILSLNPDTDDTLEEEQLKLMGIPEARRRMGKQAAEETDTRKSLTRLLWDAAAKDKSILLSMAAVAVPAAAAGYAWHATDDHLKKKKKKEQEETIADMDNQLNQLYFEELQRSRKGISKQAAVPVPPAVKKAIIRPATVLAGGAGLTIGAGVLSGIKNIAKKLSPSGTPGAEGGMVEAVKGAAGAGWQGAKSLYALYAVLAIMGTAYGADSYLARKRKEDSKVKGLEAAISDRNRAKDAPAFVLPQELRTDRGPDTVRALPSRSSLEPLRLPAGQKEIAI